MSRVIDVEKHQEIIESLQQFFRNNGMLRWRVKSPHDGSFVQRTPFGNFMMDWAIFYTNIEYAQVVVWVPHHDGEQYRLFAKALAVGSSFPWRIEWDLPPTDNLLYSVVAKNTTLLKSLKDADSKHAWLSQVQFEEILLMILDQVL